MFRRIISLAKDDGVAVELILSYNYSPHTNTAINTLILGIDFNVYNLLDVQVQKYQFNHDKLCVT